MEAFAKSEHRLPDSHEAYGSVSWKSPSNIALIKYWGKRPVQIPQNASISFTLDDAYTKTTVRYAPRRQDERWIQFQFEGKQEISFAKRIESFFHSINKYFPFLTQLKFEITSENSFPHSSGIASSASSMSALAMCLCDIENQLFDLGEKINLQKASFISRLGSGSASRSVYPILAAWGQNSAIPGSSDLYAVPFSEVDPIYKSFHDDVLIVSAEKKSVSSSAGHQLMEQNIFASQRYRQAHNHLNRLLKIMKSDDLFGWGEIIESEAMTLHALMMCSSPSYILMKPETIQVIDALRRFRKESGTPVFFTLDAGPNVHILYPDQVKSNIKAWIGDLLNTLPTTCYVIADKVGHGPDKLNNA